MHESKVSRFERRPFVKKKICFREGPTLETLDFYIVSTPTFLYFNSYLNIA